MFSVIVPRFSTNLVQYVQYFIHVKVKVITCRVDTEGDRRYSCILSLTSALDMGVWSTPHLVRVSPRKQPRYPLYGTLGWPRSQSGRVRRRETSCVHRGAKPDPSSP